MASVIEKFRIITLGNFHQFLDAVIDLNSVAACKQAVRDLEEAKKQIMREAAVATGRVNQAKGEAARLQLQIDTNTEHAQLLLDDDDPTNDVDAQRLLERVVECTEDLEVSQHELAEAQKTAAALKDATEKIIRKHTEMVRNVRRLETLQRQTEAKEKATGALQMAADMGSAADGVSIDNAQRRLEGRAFAADAKFDQAMSSMGDVEESVTTAKAKALLAKMRAKKTAAGAPEAATGS